MKTVAVVVDGDGVFFFSDGYTGTIELRVGKVSHREELYVGRKGQSRRGRCKSWSAERQAKFGDGYVLRGWICNGRVRAERQLK